MFVVIESLLQVLVINVFYFILLHFSRARLNVLVALCNISVCFSQVNVEHMDRLSTKFGGEEHKGDKENGEEPENADLQKSSKPDDFQLLFEGNNEDDFMIGIKFTR